MKIFRIKLVAVIIILSFLFFLSSCEKSEEESKFTFAFLTDIHVQPEKNADMGFIKAIGMVNQLNPDFVITGGDLIMDASKQTEARADSLYDLYIELSALLNMPVYNTMGNHELFGIYEESGVDPSHPLYGEKMYEERIGERYFAFNYQGWRFYILDSVDEKEDSEGYYGHVDTLQLLWLEEDLRGVDPLTPIVISVHIPFISLKTQLPKGGPENKADIPLIINGTDVISLFGDHNLKLVLQGHLHILEDVYAVGIHFITGGAVCGNWWDGPYGDTEEGFIVLNVEGEEFTWEYIDYGWTVKK